MTETISRDELKKKIDENDDFFLVETLAPDRFRLLSERDVRPELSSRGIYHGDILRPIRVHRHVQDRGGGVSGQTHAGTCGHDRQAAATRRAKVRSPLMTGRATPKWLIRQRVCRCGAGTPKVRREKLDSNVKISEI